MSSQPKLPKSLRSQGQGLKKESEWLLRNDTKVGLRLLHMNLNTHVHTHIQEHAQTHEEGSNLWKHTSKGYNE